MRTYLTRAPWWVLSMVQGVLFGVWMGACEAIDESEVGWSTIIRGAFWGVIFGSFMGPLTARQNTKRRAAIGEVAPHDLSTVYRASWRGAVPADPEVRSAAARATAYALDTMLRQRTWATVILAAMAVGSLVLAMDSAWWLPATAVFIILVAQQWYWPYRLRRRLDLMTGSPRS